MKYSPTIGLEIHAELNTRSKMFCDCRNDPDEKEPNKNVCPICLAHPGSLPVINKKAVEKVLQVGLALNGKLADQSKFDRKNYFYPDLPKNYQISQYDLPLVIGGSLNDVKITRIHLEEDTGRLQHNPDGNTFVDYNRAGLPLMELVTEPDIKTSEEAVSFAKELQLILRYLGASNADMEKGNMRVEVNISLSNDNARGTKVEVKNINSFKAAAGAIEYEIERQSKLLNEEKSVKQETRGWNDVKKTTESQRSKEEAHDYRYFPEPDLPPLTIDAFDITQLKQEIPELPEEKRKRLEREYGLNKVFISLLIDEASLADYFESAVSELQTFTKDNEAVKILLNYLVSDLRGLITAHNIKLQDLKFTQEDFAHLIALIYTKKITSRLAKDILVKMVNNGGDPENILKDEGLGKIVDESELNAVIKKIIESNPTPVADYKSGKENALQFLIGQVMKDLRGGADPNIIKSLIKKNIS